MVLTALLLGGLVGLNAQDAPTGIWKTVDDNTGETRSEMELYINDAGELEGRIHKLYDADAPETCDLCPGDKKDAKLLGMIIMWGLEQDGDQWEGGRIMDPENGKTYKCYIEEVEKGKLKVRGFVGIAALGRTQYWYKN